jgi:hypothetical protein
MIANGVEKDVLAYRGSGNGFGEIFAGVVDDTGGAELEDQFEVLSAAHAGDFGTKGVSDLGGEGADASGCTINQNFARWLNGRSIGVESAEAKSLKCGERCDGNGGGLFEGNIAGLGDDGGLLGAGEFGEGPSLGAEDGVTGPKLGDAGADGIDYTGDVYAEAGIFWFGEASGKANSVGQSAHEMPVVRIDGRRADS